VNVNPIRSGLAAIAFSAFAVSATQATTLDFICFTNNVPGDCSQLSQNIKVDISNPADDDVLFVFRNQAPIPATVSNIYWDSSLLNYGSPVITNSPGVIFSVGGNPPTLPGGQMLTPPFASDFRVSAEPPPATNGIEPGEQLMVKLDLALGVSYGDFLSSFAELNGSRIGLHVISVGLNEENSESMITVIPVPGALPLMLSGILGLSLLARRRRNNSH